MKVNGQWVPCVRNSFYSFMPVFLLIFMCLLWTWFKDMRFGYNSQIFFLFELSHFFGHFSEWIEGNLCVQLHIQFNTETLQMLFSCFEDMHVVGIINFLSLCFAI